MDGRSAANPTDPAAGERLFDAVREAERFFMATDAVHRALEKLVGLLAAGRIPYALVGAMALNEYGYRRVTVDVDDEPAVRAKLSERGRADEPFFGNCGHARSLELQVMFKSSAGG